MVRDAARRSGPTAAVLPFAARQRGFCGRFVPGVLGDLIGWRGAFLTLAGLSLTGAVTEHLGSSSDVIK
jgi:hypothetical protein